MAKPEEIIKIVQIKSKDRIIVPKIARERLNVKKLDHLAFIDDGNRGLRLQKVNIDNLD